MTVVSISMPDSLRTTVDQYAETHGYGGRSEVVRQALREFCVEVDDERDGPRLVTFVVCFEYGNARVEQRVATVRRDADCVVAHTHGHAAGCCLDIVVAYASPAQRHVLAADLRAIAGVDSIEQSVATLADGPLAASDQ